MYGLLERDLVNIRFAIGQFPEIRRVILFGSRALGTNRPGSDVDIAIVGDKVTRTTVLRLSDLLNEQLPLPYVFDILDYANIDSVSLRDHVDTCGVLLTGV